MWFVYIIQCSDNSLYAGITTDLKRRIKEHNNQLGGKYTRVRVPVKLVYKEKHKRKGTALKREIQIKGWGKEEKIALINSKKLRKVADNSTSA